MTPWDERRARAGIAAIVADAESSLRDGVWEHHPLDVDENDPPWFTGIYLGSAGMIWALHTLGSTLDLAALIDQTLNRFRSQPDFPDEVTSLVMGESGIELVARVVGGSHDEERLRALVVENERNKSWEWLWGSPGTILAAREAGLEPEWERSAAILAEQWQPDGLFTQDLYGKTRQFLGPGHGFAGCVHALRGYLDNAELRHRVEPVVRQHAIADGDGVNWPPVPDMEPDRVQWCHGAPGMVATIGDLMPTDLMLGGAELTWQTGPLEKGAGLCHGTAGNGYALLRAHELTGDERWLERARSFALDALDQVESMRAEYGRGRFTLFTGDVGAALFAQSCIDVDARFPTMDVW